MSSSEVVDSGRVSSHKSSQFSQTCSMLSLYLKEKRSFGDLTLGTPTAATTMNLFPMIEKYGESESRNPPKPMNLFPQSAVKKNTDFSVAKPEPEKAQMTMFYGGQVIVFNDFPADKAKEIMFLASNGSSNKKPRNNFVFPMVTPKTAESASPASNILPNLRNNLIQELPQCQIPFQPLVSDLPIARRASLTRFLEKRKDRLIAKAPYLIGKHTNEAADSKLEERRAWLGLGAQFTLKTEH